MMKIEKQLANSKKLMNEFCKEQRNAKAIIALDQHISLLERKVQIAKRFHSYAVLN